MVVKPFFGAPHKLSIVTDIFVLMPFSDSLKPVFDDHISHVSTMLDLTVARADNFFTNQSIMSDIWSGICSTQLIVADCTGRNTNVFYEVGLSHSIGKPVILITQKTEDVPFDLRHIRYICYEFTPRGMKDFEDKLMNTILTTLDDLEDVRKPVFNPHFQHPSALDAIVDDINGAGWTTCPNCNSRFSIKHGLRWGEGGYRHWGCGQPLRLIKP